MRVEHFSEDLEKSLDRVVANLPARTPEVAPNSNLEKERVKEALRRITEEEPIELKTETPSSVPDYLYAENTEPSVQKKIEYLIEVAIKDGLSTALKLSKKQDIFIQDALHDALTDKLLPELRARGHI